MPRDVQSLTSLTDQQRSFLDTYLSSHNPVAKAYKFGQASDYDGRRGKVLAELNKLPDLPPVRAQLATSLGLGAPPNELHEILDGADADADQGNFKTAFKSLENVKLAARNLANSYDVTADLTAFEQRVNTLVNEATAAIAPKQQRDVWLTACLQYLSQVPAQLDVDSLAGPNGEADVPVWCKNMKQIADAKALELEQFDAMLKSGRPWLSDLEKFLKTAESKIEALNQEARQLLQGCRDNETRQRLAAVQIHLTNSVAQVPALASLKVNGRYPIALDNSHDVQLKLAIDLSKASVNALRAWIDDELANVQAGREPPHDADAATGVSRRNLRKLRAERRRDGKLSLEEAAVNLADHGTFDFSGLQQDLAYNLPDGSHDESSLPYRKIVDDSKDDLKDYLLHSHLDLAGAEFFDLKLKTTDELMSEFARLAGWPADRRQWTSGQEAAAKAVATGWMQAVREASPSRLDVGAGQVTFPGGTYGNRRVIGRGGAGLIAKYENPLNPDDVIVVKSMIEQDAQAQQDLIQELKAHRRLMDGEPGDRRRRNVVELLDVVTTDDGALHMVLELVDGGDLEEHRQAMSVASDMGLPEQARSLLNQYMLKQAMDGVSYMRDQNLVHFDLKPDNMFLTSDGTLKIADFGSARTMDDQGKVAEFGNQTPGYYDKLETEFDTKTDAFSLGRTLGVLEAMSPEAAKRGGKAYVGQLTGAAGRLKGAMTSEDRQQRPTLEGALDSAYLQNLEQFPPESLQELAALSVRYGQEMKRHFQQVGRGELAKIFPEFASATARRPEKDTFKEWTVKLRTVIFEVRERIAGYKAKFEEGPAEDQKFMLQQELQKDQARLQELEQASASLGDSPELKALMQQMRDLTDQLTHHSEALGENAEADLEQFVKQLTSAADDGTTFHAYVSLKANAAAMRLLGVDPGQLSAASDFQRIVMTDDAEADSATLATAQQQIDALLRDIQRNDVRAVVGRGLGNILRDLAKQFRARHGKRLPLTSEAVGHSALPKFDWNSGASKSWKDAKKFARNAGIELDDLRPLDSAIKQAASAFAKQSKDEDAVERRADLRQKLSAVAAVAEDLARRIDQPALRGFLETVMLDSQAKAELAMCNPSRVVWTRDPVKNWENAAAEAIAAGEAFGPPDVMAKAIALALEQQEKWDSSDRTNKRRARHAFEAYSRVVELANEMEAGAQTKGFQQYLADFAHKTEARRRGVQALLENSSKT